MGNFPAGTPSSDMHQSLGSYSGLNMTLCRSTDKLSNTLHWAAWVWVVQTFYVEIYWSTWFATVCHCHRWFWWIVPMLPMSIMSFLPSREKVGKQKQAARSTKKTLKLDAEISMFAGVIIIAESKDCSGILSGNSFTSRIMCPCQTKKMKCGLKHDFQTAELVVFSFMKTISKWRVEGVA